MALGFLTGVVLLTRGTFLLTVPLLLAFVPQHKRLLFIAGICAALLPWTARNAVELQASIPFSTGTGYVLLGANNPTVYDAFPGWWPWGQWVNDYTHELWDSGLTEVEQDREATRRAVAYARSQSPEKLLQVALARLLMFVGVEGINVWPVVVFAAVCGWSALRSWSGRR